MSKTDGIFYSFNKDGFYVGSDQSKIDPLETIKAKKNIYTLPASATWKAPGTISEGKQAKYTKSSDSWGMEKIPKTEKDITRNIYGIPLQTLSAGELTDKTTSSINTSSDVVAWKMVRLQRDIKLRESDFSQLADVQAELSDSEKTAWASYRKKLRDLPGTITNPKVFDEGQSGVNWPVKPE